MLGETKLICWSTCPTDRPTDPILSKNKKIVLQNFGQLAFFLIYYFLLFEKKKKRNNQEAFIFIIINYKLQVFLKYVFPFKISFLKKYRP